MVGMLLRKKHGMQAVAAAIMLTLALGAFGCANEKKDTAKSAKPTVGIVQVVEHKALDAAAKGIVDGLAAKGYKEGQNITFDRQNAQGDQSNLANIAHRFITRKTDLICAIATPAAQAMAHATTDIPIVATAVTDYTTAKLVQDPLKPGKNITGTTDMNPVAKQLDLLLQLVPTAKTVGVLYCSSEVNSQLQVDILKKAAAAKNVKVQEAPVTTINDLLQSTHSLVGKVDAIYVPTDNLIASAMPTVAGITQEAKIPVICGESGPVKEGGLATLGVDYYKLGFQSGEMAADILAGKAKPADMPIQPQKDFKVLLNMKTAEKIGLKLPEALLKDAEIIK